MERLSHRDIGLVLQAVARLHSDSDPSTLSERLFSAVSHCVDTDITAIDGWNSRRVHLGTIFYHPVETMSPGLLEVFNAHVLEHPLVPNLIFGGDTRTLKISDFLSIRDFRRSGLYNEFYKYVGVDSQISTALNISEDLMVSFTLSRNGIDFGERDRVILELLKPHLVNSLRITEALKQLVAQRDYLSRYARTGVVVFDFEGKVRFTSPVVDEWVKAYFELKPSEEIPTELASFAQAQIRSVTGPEYYLPPGTIAFRSMDRELIVRAIVDFEKRELTLLLNEKRERKSADFVALGFTPREADVLIWMAKGFSDEAIAIMCGIGPRTVQKHVEHIRHKLNVESRTAAVLTVLELLEHRP